MAVFDDILNTAYLKENSVTKYNGSLIQIILICKRMPEKDNFRSAESKSLQHFFLGPNNL